MLLIQAVTVYGASMFEETYERVQPNPAYVQTAVGGLGVELYTTAA